MSSPLASIPAEQQKHRDALGRAITIWMRKNGWSQQTFHDTAKLMGTEGPWNSQISLCQRGRLDSKALFWVGLGAFNALVAEQAIPKEASRALRDRLSGSEPFLLDRGTPAKAADFFAMFIGEAPIPEAYGASYLPNYTEDDAAGISQMCRDAFRRIATDNLQTPKEAWDDLKPHCAGLLSISEITRLREVLSGWGDWTVEEVIAQSVPGQLGRPAQALERWSGTKLTMSQFRS